MIHLKLHKNQLARKHRRGGFVHSPTSPKKKEKMGFRKIPKDERPFPLFFISNGFDSLQVKHNREEVPYVACSSNQNQVSTSSASCSKTYLKKPLPYRRERMRLGVHSDWRSGFRSNQRWNPLPPGEDRRLTVSCRRKRIYGLLV